MAAGVWASMRAPLLGEAAGNGSPGVGASAAGEDGALVCGGEGSVLADTVPGQAATLAAQVPVQSAEEVFIKAFYAGRLVQECMDARKGKPGMPGGLRSTQSATTLGAVIRRWFIGRQTVRKAAQKTEQLSLPLTDAAVAQNSALVGTAAMFELARLRPDLVWITDSEHAGYIELTMAVTANKW